MGIGGSEHLLVKETLKILEEGDCQGLDESLHLSGNLFLSVKMRVKTDDR